MEYSIHNVIANMQIATPQIYKNLTVFPVMHKTDNQVWYISLDKALSKDYIKINEVSESGSVNTLNVENNSDYNVLLLDGEELIGAKQNRVLNTTILLGQRSKTQIPVSCVERGRWSYRSKSFNTSNRIMSSKIKSRKMFDVSHNLKLRPDALDYSSDQGRVWQSVDELLHEKKAFSHSSAMSEAFETSESKMNKYLSNFKLEQYQKGMIVAINGKIVGFEYLSSVTVFTDYFQKLLRGFVIDAIDNEKEHYEQITNEQCKNFVNLLKNSQQSNFQAIGLGNSFRYTGDESVAAALVHQDETIHLSQLYKEVEENIHENPFANRMERPDVNTGNTIRRNIL